MIGGWREEGGEGVERDGWGKGIEEGCVFERGWIEEGGG